MYTWQAWLLPYPKRLHMDWLFPLGPLPHDFCTRINSIQSRNYPSQNKFELFCTPVSSLCSDQYTPEHTNWAQSFSLTHKTCFLISPNPASTVSTLRNRGHLFPSKPLWDTTQIASQVCCFGAYKSGHDMVFPGIIKLHVCLMLNHCPLSFPLFDIFFSWASPNNQ